MNKTELERPVTGFWKKRWFPWVLAAVLVLAAGAAAGLALSARDRQRELEQELQLQRETIQSLRADAAKKEEEGLIRDSEPEITSSLVDSQLNGLEELVTTEYMYTNSGKYDNRNQATIIRWDINIPFTEKSFIVAYDGSIKAGVDISRAQVEINEDARVIHITLPKSEIISHETFEDTLVVLDEKNNVFNPISISDYNEFVERQKAAMEQKAVDRGILTSASEEARRVVRSLLSALPGIDAYRIIVQ